MPRMTQCRNCGGTVFIPKRSGLATFLGIALLLFFIVPGVLVLWLAPKHMRCASCGTKL